MHSLTNPYGFYAPLGASALPKTQNALRIGLGVATALLAFNVAPAFLPFRGNFMMTAGAAAAAAGGWFVGTWGFDQAYKAATGVSTDMASSTAQKIANTVTSLHI